MHKWWHERAKPGSPTCEEPVSRLARVNATAAIAIETADQQLVDRDTDAGDGESPRIGRVDERLLNEDHHKQYGHPWALGKCVFEFVVSAGVLPGHRLLDFGCGALRFGHRVIPYLEAGNYFGVDSHLPSLEAAATYEIPLHGLAEKRPRLLWNEDLALSHFGTTFDWIVDYSSSRRMKPKKLRSRAYASFAEVLAKGGRLLTSPRPAVPIEAFAEWGLTLSRDRVIHECPLLEGHSSFKSRTAWWEFVRE